MKANAFLVKTVKGEHEYIYYFARGFAAAESGKRAGEKSSNFKPF